MATKPTKTTRKKTSGKVRDLTARKNPSGGAQKREGPGMNATSQRGGAALPSGKRYLA
ncbi:MAG: hypothetical protein ACREIF_04105 [Chthoniobacterales bacterium]